MLSITKDQWNGNQLRGNITFQDVYYKKKIIGAGNDVEKRNFCGPFVGM